MCISGHCECQERGVNTKILTRLIEEAGYYTVWLRTKS